MDAESGCHLCSGKPPATAEPLHPTLDAIGCADATNCNASERLASTRTEPSGIERAGNLGIDLLCGQCTNHLHDTGRCSSQIRSTQRDGALQNSGGCTFPADVDPNHLATQERDILNEKPQQSLTFPRRCARIVPDSRQIRHQTLNPRSVLGTDRNCIGLGGLSVVLFSRWPTLSARRGHTTGRHETARRSRTIPLTCNAADRASMRRQFDQQFSIWVNWGG